MKPPRGSRLLLAAAAISLAPLLGCASSDHMRTASGAPAPPAADTATVVFLRPSGMASGITTTILDGNGRFLGDSLPSSHFSVKVPPGEHLFLAWAENTAALRATLAAGKTYYVKVSPRMGALSARMQLLALTPRNEDWPKLKEWLGKKGYEPNTDTGQRYLDSRKDDVAKRVKRANDILKEYDPKELEERTLRAEDGQ